MVSTRDRGAAVHGRQQRREVDLALARNRYSPFEVARAKLVLVDRKRLERFVFRVENEQTCRIQRGKENLLVERAGTEPL